MTYVDLELSNWGYEFRFTPSLIVLAAIFRELCVVDGGPEEYHRMYPSDDEGLELGDCWSEDDRGGSYYGVACYIEAIHYDCG